MADELNLNSSSVGRAALNTAILMDSICGVLWALDIYAIFDFKLGDSSLAISCMNNAEGRLVTVSREFLIKDLVSLSRDEVLALGVSFASECSVRYAEALNRKT